MTPIVKRYASVAPESYERTMTRAQWKAFETDCRVHRMPMYRRTRFTWYPAVTVIGGRDGVQVYGPAGKLP